MPRIEAIISQPSKVEALVTGGIGPAGPQGSPGSPGPSGPPNRLADLLDVDVAAVSIGDVLRYTGEKWRGYHETALTDGGNF
jgi:hypothetical protein